MAKPPTATNGKTPPRDPKNPIQVGADFTPWQNLLSRMYGIDDSYVRVGVLASKGGNATLPDSDITLIELAAIHEFGSPSAGIPERSFIRRTFDEKGNELKELTTRVAKLFMKDKLTIEKALGMLGEWGASEIKKTVTAGPHIPPPLKAATIARKGSDRPLVDTGRLVNSMTYELVINGGPGPEAETL